MIYSNFVMDFNNIATVKKKKKKLTSPDSYSP